MAGVSAPPVTLATPRKRRGKWVPPLMAIAVAILLAALWSGLVHLGMPLPQGGQSLHSGHGPMMVLGFLGTLISLERAVSLGAVWGYLAPAAAGLGGLSVIVGAPDGISPALVTLGGVVLVAIFVALHRLQASLHNVVLAAGAVCWVVAGVLWLVGWAVPLFVPWMVGFLVLTITGERLELSRLTGSSPLSKASFTAAAGVFAVGLVVSVAAEGPGVRIAGLGLLALAIWLARYDIARRTVRTSGVTRFMAVALLSGYVWLATTGVLWVAIGELSSAGVHNPAYDAMLHAVFLGFVISMIFAHAPVIVPAVLGVHLPYRPVLYLPLALLHASLLLRLLGGDALDSTLAWQWGGSLNEVALLLYVVLAASSVLRARRHHAQPTAANR